MKCYSYDDRVIYVNEIEEYLKNKDEVLLLTKKFND